MLTRRHTLAAAPLTLTLLLLVGCDGAAAAGSEPDALADVGGAPEDVAVAAPDAGSLADVAEGASDGANGAPDAATNDVALSPIAQQCVDHIGPPRVEELADGLFVAIGYDLANTILIATPEGNVVIDVSMSPTRAEPVKAALQAVAPGPTRAIIYTHSHIDHVGGASVWREPTTEIWATDAFMQHFLKQYGAFRAAETARGARQFGQHAGEDELPCSAIGRTADVVAALSTGFVQPTHTFSGQKLITVGGVELVLVEAHGETHDALFVWIPSLGALLCGDNFYAAFPNLYTIRGTSARPIDEWIGSLDAMRAYDPELLVPSHTRPLVGRDAIRAALRDYRDAIAWLVAEVTRGANALEPLPTMVSRVSLPEHLVASPYLAERYGQVDWSVKAIYQQALGWFDGRADTLYPPSDIEAREVALMGGAEAVLGAAQAALAGGDPRWATHLLAKLRDAQALPAEQLAPRLAEAYRAVAAGVENTNGRGYLLESAWELSGGEADAGEVTLGPDFVQALPPELIFELLGPRLQAKDAMDVLETMAVTLTDRGSTWYVTVRRGVVEVTRDVQLPDSPSPVAHVVTTAATWVGMSLRVVSPVEALADGSLVIDDVLGALTFLGRFDQGI